MDNPEELDEDERDNILVLLCMRTAHKGDIILSLSWNIYVRGI